MLPPLQILQTYAMHLVEAVHVWLVSLSCLTLVCEGRSNKGPKLEEETMNAKTRTIAVRTLGAVVASVFALPATAGPASAATAHPTKTVGSVQLAKDSGW